MNKYSLVKIACANLIATISLLCMFFAFSSGMVFAASGGSDSAGGCAPGKICNPLQSDTFEDLLLKIIEIILIFAIPIIVIFIMYAGYLFVTARGDSGQISDARNALLWSVIGGVIILGAKLIIDVIEGTVDAL